MNGSGQPDSGVTRVVSRVATVVSGLVLTAAGVYVVIYLARWEWNRALVSAAVFIAMLQVLSTAVLASRLRALSTTARVVIINRGTDDADLADPSVSSSLGNGMGDAVAEALRQSNDARASRWFEWLRSDSGQTAVFIPVLLGTGMILSAIAWVVERAAGLVARRSVDPHAASSVPLHLPLGVTVAGNGGATEVAARHRPVRRWTAAFLVAVALVVAGVGVEAVRRLTQSTRDAPGRHGSSELVVEVRSLDERPPVQMATALWTVCRERLDQWPVATVTAVAGSEVTMQLDRALSDTARRRLVGCLEDFTLERVLGTVVRVDVDDEDEDDQRAIDGGTGGR
ncbi:MAG: hypothetical protein ACO3C1_13510 [Ilumatobacteraceae bacterium]